MNATTPAEALTGEHLPAGAPAPDTRLYEVIDRATGQTLRLSRAKTRDGALAKYVSGALDVRLPTQPQLIAAVRAGVPSDDDATADRRAEADAAGVRG